MKPSFDFSFYKICFLFKICLLCFFVLSVPIPSYANELASFANLAVEANPYSGSANFGIPIQVPSGRGGIEPNLQLGYNSSVANGILGVGWSLELGRIQRSNKEGLPRYDDSDTFVLIQSGQVKELVFDPSVGYYRSKIEGDFLKVERINSFWQVTDKSGTQYYFGQSDQAREYNPAQPKQVYQWAFEHVNDVHGNTMRVEYARYGSQILPQRILYTGNDAAGIKPHASVVFKHQEHPDRHNLTDYKRGYRYQTQQMIRGIEVYADDTLQRRYDFAFVTSASTGRMLLDHVQLVGADGVTTLPAMRFDYQSDPSRFKKMSIDSSLAEGDNLWNIHQDPGFDQGHDNFVACGFGLDMEHQFDQYSGSSSCGSFEINRDSATLKINGRQDCANAAWTYVFSEQDKTINLNRRDSDLALCAVVNGERVTRDNAETIRLQAGWNSIQYFFHSQHADPQFEITSNLAEQVDVVSSKPRILGTIAGDFNGDGLTDLARQSDGAIRVALNKDGVFLAEQVWLQDANVELNHIIWRAVDVNADGKADMVRWNAEDGTWWLSLSTGEGFTPYKHDQYWLTNVGWQGDKTSFADVNGDGFPDMVIFQPNHKVSVLINQEGEGFKQDAVRHPISLLSPKEEGFAADFNGDGLADIAGFDYWNGRLRIWFNNGNLADGDIEQEPLKLFIPGARKPVVADFNQDGRVDFGYLNTDQGVVNYRTFMGNDFGPQQELPITFDVRTASASVSAADFNGDTMPDFLAADETGNMEIAMSTSTLPDLLKRVDNGVGGYTSIEYVPVNKTIQNNMPFPMQVVRYVTRSTSLGDAYRTYNEYRDGLWDAEAREFRGFGTVRVMDHDGNVVESVYHQDGVLQGMVKQQDTYDEQENLYARVVNTYAVENIGEGGSQFVYLQRRDNFVYDGDQQGRRTAEEYFYEETPQRGALTQSVQLGEVDEDTGEDIGNDGRMMRTTYLNNEEQHILSVPAYTATATQRGRIMHQTWFRYDDLEQDATPIKGLLTAKEVRASRDGVDRIVTTYTYDDVGNLIATTGPRGNTTSIEYDPDYRIFPLATMNQLGHRVVNAYFGVNGVGLDEGDGLSGLWGQLKSTTDPNDEYGLKSYDVFGRPVFSVGPLDTVSKPSSTREYNIDTHYSCVKSSQRIEHGQEAMISSNTCFDGLGREVMTASPSEKPGQYVVTGLTQYDSRGLPTRQYYPRFTEDPFEPISQEWLHQYLEYDPVGRLIKSVNPDGTFSNIIYDDWTAITFNENGHKQASDYDAFGRLIAKREFTGADGRAAQYYPAEAYALYALTQYEYDTEGNLIKTIDDHGNETRLTYDMLGRKIRMDDPDMGRWTYTYDVAGNMIAQTDAEGQTLQFEYDALNRLVRKYDGHAVDVRYDYDDPYVVKSKGRITRAAYNNDTEHARFGYDALGREVQSVKMFDQTQYQVQRDYDALSRLKHLTYPHQSQVHYSYNAAGQIETVSNVKVVQEDLDDKTDDDHKDDIQPPQPKPLPSPWAYFKFDDNGSTARLQNDGLGQDHGVLINEMTQDYSIEGVLGNALRFNSDACGNVNDFTRAIADDAQGSFSFWARNPVAGRVLQIFQSDQADDREGAHAAAITLEHGNVVMSIIKEGTPILGFTAQYPALLNGQWHHVAIVQDGQAPKVYVDAQEIPLTYYDATVDTTHWFNSVGKHFVRGRLFCRDSSHRYSGDLDELRYYREALDPQQINTLYNNGFPLEARGDIPQENRLARAIEGLGVALMASMDWIMGTTDAHANPLLKAFPGMSAGSQPPQISMMPLVEGFEGSEMVVDVTAQDDDRDTLTFTRPLADDLPEGARFVVTRDEAGMVQGRLIWDEAVGDPGGDKITIPVEVSDGKAHVMQSMTLRIHPTEPDPSQAMFIHNVDYTAQGQISTIEYGNGVVTEYEYDEVTLRLSRIHTYGPTGKLQDLNYTYDPVGHVVAIDDALHGATQRFKYDALQRLVWAQGEEYGIKTYAYDTIGNIIEKDGLRYTYGDKGAGPHAVTALSDGTFFTYDANGNLKTKTHADSSLTQYHYDAEHRLTEVYENKVLKAAYTYDGDGGRTSKTVRGVQTKFIGSVYEETADRQTQHVFLGSTRIASVTDGGIMYHHGDHLGGANVISNDQGAIEELIEYTPFGTFARHEKFGNGEDVAWHYFTGQHYDKETDLYFYNARYYDPSLGRFISADTIVQASSNPQTFNRYAYTSNNPINRVDPSGHSWFKKAWNWFKGNTIVGGFFQAVDTGDWKAYGRQVAVLVISSFASVIVPGAGAALASNFFANVGLHIVRGAAIGALAGGVSSEIMGGSFSSGAQLGAIGGAVGGVFSGISTSEQYQNWTNGNGWKNNSEFSNQQENIVKMYNMLSEESHRYFDASKYKLSVGSNGGHAAIGLEGVGWKGKYPANTGFSYGGESSNQVTWLFGRSSRGIIKTEGVGGSPNFLKSPPETKSWTINQLQKHMITDYIDRGGGIFSLSTNCADWALGAVRTGGIYVPSNMTTYGYTDPNHIKSWISLE